MKYEVTKDAEGFTHLKLGLNHSVHFDPDAGLEDVIGGVEDIIQRVVGVSAFELTMAVVAELNKEPEEKADAE